MSAINTSASAVPSRGKSEKAARSTISSRRRMVARTKWAISERYAINAMPTYSESSADIANRGSSVLTASPYSFVCETCGKQAHRKPSGTNRRKGYRNRFCSMQCRRDGRVAPYSKLRPCAGCQRMVPIKRLRCEVCAAQHYVAELEAKRLRNAQARAAAPRPCAVCGAAFLPGKSLAQEVCSARCIRRRNRAYPSGRAARSASKAVYRSRMRVARVERFDPLAVFERDGWICQICGSRTPQKYRGTYHDRAPELDHIFPLAKGGEHSMANTQCACRACNIHKADSAPVGQIGVFGNEWPGGISKKKLIA